MVDRKPKTLQWEVYNSSQASDSNTDRCVTGRLGSQLLAYVDWGKMVHRREEITYKYPRTHGGKECHLSFHKEKTINAVNTQTSNTTALSSLLKMGGTTDKTLVRFKQGHLKVSDIEADHNYYKISPRYSEHKSRLAVLSQQEPLGMKVISNSIPRYLPENGDASDRSLCFHIIQWYSKISCLETDTHSLAIDAMQQECNQGILYAFLPFLLIQRVLSKITKEKDNTVILITPVWQTQPWYPNLLAMSFSQPFLLPMSPGVLKNPRRKDHPLVINKSLALGAWKVTWKLCLSQAFQKELPILSLTQRDKVHQLITTLPGKNGLAGALGNNLIHFAALQTMF